MKDKLVAMAAGFLVGLVYFASQDCAAYMKTRKASITAGETPKPFDWQMHFGQWVVGALGGLSMGGIISNADGIQSVLKTVLGNAA